MTDITDMRHTPETIIIDLENWNETSDSNSDDIYRILLDDGIAIDCYINSFLLLEAEIGRIYPNGGTNAVQMSISNARYIPDGRWLKIRTDMGCRIDIDCHKVISVGVISWDMSLYGANPRTIQ